MLVACVQRLEQQLSLGPTPLAAAEQGEGACLSPPEDGLADEGVGLELQGLEMIDYLSVVLPAVRILYDWFLCQHSLHHKCLEAIKHQVL